MHGLGIRNLRSPIYSKSSPTFRDGGLWAASIAARSSAVSVMSPAAAFSRTWACVGGLGDGNHVAVAQPPCDRHRAGVDTMPLRDRLQRGGTEQAADVVPERGVGHEGDAVGRTPRQQVEFNPAAVGMVQDLIRPRSAARRRTPSNSFMSAVSRLETPQ